MGAYLTAAGLLLRKTQVSKVSFVGLGLQVNDTLKIQLPVIGGKRIWTKTLVAGELATSGGNVYAKVSFPVPTFVPDSFDSSEKAADFSLSDDLGQATVTLTRNNNVIDTITSGVVAEA